jgi:hypothetical protein
MFGSVLQRILNSIGVDVMIGRSANNEVEGMWKEAIVTCLR